MTCAILVGGRGTRLRSVVSDRPKPMAALGGRPFLAYLLHQLVAVGCQEVVLCTGYKAKMIERYFDDGERFRLRIHYVRDPEPRGTAGALLGAKVLLRSDPFIVMNGDTYCPVDFHALLHQHCASAAVATIVVTPSVSPEECGRIVLGDHNAIAQFIEKDVTHAPGLVNSGVYACSQVLFDWIPIGRRASLEHEVFPLLVERGLYAFRVPGPFVDIGSPKGLARARQVLTGLKVA